MKKIMFIIGLFVFYGCGPDGLDCFQNAGTIIQEEFSVDTFKKVQVWERVQLIISQGETQSIVVETGENLMNEIKVRVEDSILTISDRNSCNFVRDYGITKAYVTTPNIDEIRNSSGLTVLSQGVLGFDELNLVSDDRFNEDEYHIDGDFRLDSLDITRLRIYANGVSKFYLKGEANVAFFGLFDSDVRVEAAELEIQHFYFFHRSTNKMIVNPRRLIIGTIAGLGDVIAVHRPNRIEVEELYTGRLIFE